MEIIVIQLDLLSVDIFLPRVINHDIHLRDMEEVLQELLRLLLQIRGILLMVLHLTTPILTLEANRLRTAASLPLTDNTIRLKDHLSIRQCMDPVTHQE